MTINHKESADSYLDGCVYETYSMTNAEKVSLAQVHATLALVEQQRLANQIAYVVKLSSHPTDLTQMYPKDVDDFHSLTASIQTGLFR